MAAACAVADDSVAIAGLLERGEVVAAMDAVVAMTDGLGTFLKCVGQAVDVSHKVAPQLSEACVAYQRRIDTLVGHVDTALAVGDLPGLGVALQDGVATGVRDFAQIEGPLQSALAGQRAAA